VGRGRGCAHSQLGKLVQLTSQLVGGLNEVDLFQEREREIPSDGSNRIREISFNHQFVSYDFICFGLIDIEFSVNQTVPDSTQKAVPLN